MPYVLLLLALLAPLAGQAEMVALTGSVPTDELLSAVTLDLNHDGTPDQAQLLRGAEGADLVVYLSTSEPGRFRRIERKHAAFLGKRLGMLPSLAGVGDDRLRLNSRNDVLGRMRFEQSLDLVIQEGQLVVAALTYQKIDPQSPENSGRCELDLLHQTGRVNEASVRPSVKAGPIATWDVLSPPGECLF